MNYVFEFNPEHKIYLQCQENQTIVTSIISSYGQQQQSSSSFQTGEWLSTPETIQTPGGLKIKITGTLGEYYIQIQGSSISLSSQQSSPPPMTMKPMEPMQPMKPLKMGNMSMDINKMEMRMGNLEMKMGAEPEPKAKFCSQCGNKLKLDDRFCSQCGSAI